jgi:AcrR family transcriptional regulator
MAPRGNSQVKNRRAPRQEHPDFRRRIVIRVRSHLFARGYSALTMDDLAKDLGMSKKTLYVSFRSKEEIVRAALDEFASEIRADADRSLADRSLGFSEKLRGFALGLMERLAQVTPEVLRDLEQHAPPLHRHVEQLRRKNIPYIFGRFIEEGQIAGKVREDINPAFAAEYYLHAMQGMMHPATLLRLRARPDVVLDQTIRIFFGGMLTPTGHKEYEKSFPQ